MPVWKRPLRHYVRLPATSPRRERNLESALKKQTGASLHWHASLVFRDVRFELVSYAQLGGDLNQTCIFGALQSPSVLHKKRNIPSTSPGPGGFCSSWEHSFTNDNLYNSSICMVDIAARWCLNISYRYQKMNTFWMQTGIHNEKHTKKNSVTHPWSFSCALWNNIATRRAVYTRAVFAVLEV